MSTLLLACGSLRRELSEIQRRHSWPVEVEYLPRSYIFLRRSWPRPYPAAWKRPGAGTSASWRSTVGALPDLTKRWSATGRPCARTG
ncbi:MAG: hypothetical protein Q8R28_15520 [Dehalococcoidia bacterium]|nr:hypothetical protein [Dehalococcoidia bacterium]